ncbi:hypothetical protein K435DRAFT_782896, partial [Dendrothele bispora CBS 962.96]
MNSSLQLYSDIQVQIQPQLQRLISHIIITVLIATTSYRTSDLPDCVYGAFTSSSHLPDLIRRIVKFKY